MKPGHRDGVVGSPEDLHFEPPHASGLGAQSPRLALMGGKRCLALEAAPEQGLRIVQQRRLRLVSAFAFDRHPEHGALPSLEGSRRARREHALLMLNRFPFGTRPKLDRRPSSSSRVAPHASPKRSRITFCPVNRAWSATSRSG